MSGLCGWSGYSGERAALRALAEAMSLSLRELDGSRAAVWSGSRSGLAEARLDGEPAVFVDGPRAAVVHGRPDFEDDDLSERARAHGVAAAFAHGFRERGPAVFATMLGAFAAAHVDDGSGEVVIATDRSGIRPVYFQPDAKGCVVFGSTCDAVDAHPAGRAEVDPQALLDYMYFGFVAAPDSIRAGRSRLLPGEYARIRDGRVERDAYWRPEYAEDDRRDFRAQRDDFFARLEAAVARDAQGARVGAFLSGGLDSSTVAGVLAGVAPPAKAYSIGFDARGYDELAYARLAARRFGLEHHEYYVTPDDVLEAIPLLARAYAEPFGNESAVPAYYCAKLAREDGVERMLAGDGGDEIFGGNERYATQKVFALYDRVPGFLRLPLEPLVFGFPWGSRIWPVRKARSYIRQAKVPMPLRLQAWNYVEREGIRGVIHPDFLTQIDAEGPRRLQRRVWEEARAKSMLNRMLALDLKFTLADCDLPKVNRMCEMAGVEVCYPMLDPALVDFTLGLKSSAKVRRFRLRHFFKEATRGFLPDRILTKTKHGFGLPFGVWLREHRPLQDLVRDSLDGLRTRGVVADAFIDRVLEAHRSEHAAYYGASIWGLLMLEQWFRAHTAAAQGVAAGS